MLHITNNKGDVSEWLSEGLLRIRSTPGLKDSFGESVYMGNCIMSSNLIVSANFYLFLFAMFYSYILLSEKDGKYYYGSTNNLQNRLLKHNKGDVKSTKHRRPLKIHFFEEFNTRSEAFQREHFYKSIVGYNWLKQNNII